jgi:hypothetical protein
MGDICGDLGVNGAKESDYLEISKNPEAENDAFDFLI